MAADESVRAKLRSVGLSTIGDSFLNSWNKKEEEFGNFNLDHHFYKSPLFQSLTGVAYLPTEDLKAAQEWAKQVLKDVEEGMVWWAVSRTDLALRLIVVAHSLSLWHKDSPVKLQDRATGKFMTGVDLWLILAGRIHADQKEKGEVSSAEKFWWAALKPFVLKFEVINTKT